MNYNIRFCLALLNLFATTAVFGATIVWDGGNGTGTAIGAATNWVGDVSPNSANGDVCQWDATVPGNLFLTASSANGQLNNGTPGVSFYIAAGHTGSWNLTSLIAGGSGNIALNATTIDSGAGAYSIGDASANVLNIIQRPSSPAGPPFAPIHTNLNNSANAATIFPNVRYQSGGGNPHVIQFDGTGDWIVNNALNSAGGGNNNNYIIKMGSGALFWNANSIAAAGGVSGIGSPIDIREGRLVLTASSIELGSQRITNNATLEYAAPASSQTLSGPINGTGLMKVSNGTLTLSSTSSDFSGNIVLTNGGVLVAGGAQTAGGTGPLGTNGPILFNGGTLQFSVANTFDYSPRFSTAANQAYSFNTGGQYVTFTNALTSSGGTLTKLGSGTLALTGANTYTGATTVSNGTLFINGNNAASSTHVYFGAKLGGTGTLTGSVTLDTGTTLVPDASIGTLTINSDLSIGGDLAIKVNKSLSQSNDILVVTGVLTNTGTGTLTVSNLGPVLMIGDKFTLFSKPLTNGAALTVAGAGATWVNNLAVDGSISVTSVSRPTLNFTKPIANNLQFSWDASFGNYKLQSQTNNLNAGLGTNWSDYPGGGASPLTVPLGVTNGAVFFRLTSTP